MKTRYKFWRWFEKRGEFLEKALDVLLIYGAGVFTWSVIVTFIHRFCNRIIDAEEWVLIPLMLGLLYVGYRVGSYYKREVAMRAAYRHGYSAGLKAQILHNDFESEENEYEMD